MEIQPAVFQTLADPSRFQIVEALLEGEVAVNDLVARMDIHQSGVSRHLRILEEAGFVRVRPDGPRRLYSLRPEPFRQLNAWVSQDPSAVGRPPRRVCSRARTQAAATSAQTADAEERMKNSHTPTAPASAPRTRITLERVYRADVQDVWDLWTTKEGIESWWGPGGFEVTVRQIDLRPGGELLYAMTAVDPPQVAFMKRAGMPLTQELRITFTEVVPRRRLGVRAPGRLRSRRRTL